MNIISGISDAFIRWRIRCLRDSERQHLGYISNHQRIYKKLKADRKELEGSLKKGGK